MNEDELDGVEEDPQNDPVEAENNVPNPVNQIVEDDIEFDAAIDDENNAIPVPEVNEPINNDNEHQDQHNRQNGHNIQTENSRRNQIRAASYDLMIQRLHLGPSNGTRHQYNLPSSISNEFEQFLYQL